MAEEKMTIEFIASLPPIKSAIQIDGQGDGGLIKLEISRQFMGELLKLQVLAGKRLRVRIEEDLTLDNNFPIEL